MIEYEYNEQQRLKNPDGTNSTVLAPKEAVAKPQVKRKASADKHKLIANTILSEHDQINMLASLVEEYLVSVNYSSPLFSYAQSKFAEIKAELAK